MMVAHSSNFYAVAVLVLSLSTFSKCLCPQFVPASIIQVVRDFFLTKTR